MRLEEKQRQERAATQAEGKPWLPQWFEQVRRSPCQTALTEWKILAAPPAATPCLPRCLIHWEASW